MQVEAWFVRWVFWDLVVRISCCDPRSSLWDILKRKKTFGLTQIPTKMSRNMETLRPLPTAHSLAHALLPFHTHMNIHTHSLSLSPWRNEWWANVKNNGLVFTLGLERQSWMTARFAFLQHRRLERVFD
jgi:hypothetical protein